RRLFDGMWNAGDDGERWGHTDVMSDVWQFNTFTCINTFTRGAGTSRILEGLMAPLGLVEPRDRIGCWLSGGRGNYCQRWSPMRSNFVRQFLSSRSRLL